MPSLGRGSSLMASMSEMRTTTAAPPAAAYIATFRRFTSSALHTIRARITAVDTHWRSMRVLENVEVHYQTWVPVCVWFEMHPEVRVWVRVKVSVSFATRTLLS